MVASAIILSPIFIQCRRKEPPDMIIEVAVATPLNVGDSSALENSKIDIQEMENISKDR